MKEFFAKDYKTRSDLERAIMRVYDLTAERKNDAFIVGTLEELNKLQLSERTIFWGISCKVTDPPQVKEKTKADRGPKTSYGINNKDKKPK